MTQILATHDASSLAAAVDAAAEALRIGEVVALPTETVYGLAADALRSDAVAKIFEAKERPFFDPLIVHIPHREWLTKLTATDSVSRPLVEALVAKFWPGPLTLVLPRTSIVPDLVTAGLETVAVRMSAHPVFAAVVERFGIPLAAPSANRFGRISPTAAAHVHAELDGRIPLILDAGSTQHGIESTIVAVEGTKLRILRAGPITAEQLAEVLGEVLRSLGESEAGTQVREFIERSMKVAAPLANPQAPGQLASHYAPRTPLRIVPQGSPLIFEKGERAGWLGWREVRGDASFSASEVLSASGDLREAAATLFAKMRRLDDAGLSIIFAEPVPEEGLGVAIMDRLRKAAAPK